MHVSEIPNFEHLSGVDRLELAEELVASIRDPDALPAPVAHRFELERRWAEYERNPDRVLTEDQFWSHVKELTPRAGHCPQPLNIEP